MTLRELMKVQHIYDGVELWSRNGHCLGVFARVDKCPYETVRVLNFTKEYVMVDVRAETKYNERNDRVMICTFEENEGR